MNDIAIPSAVPVTWNCTLTGRPGRPRFCRVEARTWFVAKKFGTTADRVIAIREPGR